MRLHGPAKLQKQNRCMSLNKPRHSDTENKLGILAYSSLETIPDPEDDPVFVLAQNSAMPKGMKPAKNSNTIDEFINRAIGTKTNKLQIPVLSSPRVDVFD